MSKEPFHIPAPDGARHFCCADSTRWSHDRDEFKRMLAELQHCMLLTPFQYEKAVNRMDKKIRSFCEEHLPTCPLCQQKTAFEGYDFSPSRKLRYVWICARCSVSLNRLCRFKWPNPSGDEVGVQDPAPTLKELLVDLEAPEEAGPYVPTEREWMNEPSSDGSAFSVDDLGSSSGEASSSTEPSPGATPQKTIVTVAAGRVNDWTVVVQEEFDGVTMPARNVPRTNLFNAVLEACSTTAATDEPLGASPIRRAREPGEDQ
mmetsp:Transcript_29919/g.61509  ORF Transcript_29919/g.61509 Transcript_29919/m.61509 type:complete len:260 (+) Transcript_29919:104-883(+)